MLMYADRCALPEQGSELSTLLGTDEAHATSAMRRMAFTGCDLLLQDARGWDEDYPGLARVVAVGGEPTARRARRHCSAARSYLAAVASNNQSSGRRTDPRPVRRLHPPQPGSALLEAPEEPDGGIAATARTFRARAS